MNEAERAELEELRGLGATNEDLEAFAHDLAALRLILTMLPGDRIFTRDEAADRAGVDRDRAASVRRLLGFADEDPQAKVASARDVEFLSFMSVAVSYVGERDVRRLLQTLGEAATRIADAATSAFLVNVELPMRADPLVADPESIAIAGTACRWNDVGV
jgi:hypothetical protein